MATLYVTDGPAQGVKFSLAGCNLAMIGRDGRCTFQITDPKLSRFHLQIRHDAQQNRHFAIDHESKNGVFINRERIEGETLLNDNDIIFLGETAIVYSNGDASDALKVFEAWKHPGQGHLPTMTFE